MSSAFPKTLVDAALSEVLDCGDLTLHWEASHNYGSPLFSFRAQGCGAGPCPLEGGIRLLSK